MLDGLDARVREKMDYKRDYVPLAGDPLLHRIHVPK